MTPAEVLFKHTETHKYSAANHDYIECNIIAAMREYASLRVMEEAERAWDAAVKSRSRVSNLKTCIKEQDWQDFKDVEIEPKTPYWVKLKNGNIVLSAWIQGPGLNSGWAKLRLSEENGIEADTSIFYLMLDAKIQSAFD